MTRRVWAVVVVALVVVAAVLAMFLRREPGGPPAEIWAPLVTSPDTDQVYLDGPDGQRIDATILVENGGMQIQAAGAAPMWRRLLGRAGLRDATSPAWTAEYVRVPEGDVSERLGYVRWVRQE